MAQIDHLVPEAGFLILKMLECYNQPLEDADEFVVMFAGSRHHDENFDKRHRIPSYRPALRRRNGGVLAIDQRNHMVPKLLLEKIERQLGVLRMTPVDDLVVRNRDDHGLGLSFGEQVVHEEVDPPTVDPARRQLTPPADAVTTGLPP